MKPWKINSLMIAGVTLVAVFLPAEFAKLVLLVLVFGSAMWVYTDSKKLGIEKYKKTALSLSSTPFGIAFVVWILWIISFPMYISWRYRVINGRIPLK